MQCLWSGGPWRQTSGSDLAKDSALTYKTIPFSIVMQTLETGMIKVQHLVKSFGDFTAVRDISFEVAQGEIFAFLGPNGAGKTTTIKMLTTLLQPTSGSIELDGLDPRTQPERSAKALRHCLSGSQSRCRTDRL